MTYARLRKWKRRKGGGLGLRKILAIVFVKCRFKCNISIAKLLVQFYDLAASLILSLVWDRIFFCFIS